MSDNQTIKVLCYLVALKNDTYMFSTEKEAKEFFDQKKLHNEKPILSALTEITTITLTKRILAC